MGTEAEFATLETYLAGNDNVFGARQLADRLASAFPSSEAALRIQGFAALRADDPEAAVHSLTAALAIPAAGDHENVGKQDAAGSHDAVGDQESGAISRRDLQQTLARAQILMGDTDAPLARAQEAVERENTADNRLNFALLLMTAQRDSAAMQQLEILSHDPKYSPVALRLLGLMEFQQGHFEAATVKFAELVRANKYLDDAFYYLGLIADRQNDAEHALRLYAQVQSGENAVPALLRASAILQTHGAPATAEELLDRLIEDEPQRAPEIIAARARMAADAGDLPGAVTVLERGRAEYPDNVDLRYAVASIYEEQGRISDSLHELTELLNVRPDDPAAQNALGYTLADHSRDLGRARRLIERAYAAAPKNSAILDSLGWVLFRQSHAVEAETYLRTAYLDDRGGDIAAHLGEVLWNLGKPDEAEHIWSEAAAVDGDNRLLKATRQRLHGTQQTQPATRKPLPVTMRPFPP
jgi:tetratricopeptide (TPR) repeat protein